MRCGWKAFFVVALILGLPWVVLATTIYDVQHNETNQGSGNDCYPSPFFNQSVTISGVVTHVGVSTGFPDFWMQDPNHPSWSGVFVFDTSVEPAMGDSLSITASVDEYYGLTEMKNIISFTIHASDAALPAPVDINSSDLGGCNVNGEAYEGMLVRLRNVTVTQATNSYGEWHVDDGSGACQIDDYLFSYNATSGQTFDAIVGIIHYSYEEYELLPRSADDIIAEQSGPPNIANTDHQPESPQHNESVVVTSQVTDDGSVSGVYLFFSTNGGSSWDFIAMRDDGTDPDQTAGDDVYSGRIDGQTGGTTVDYYIHAVDDEEQESFDPANAPTSTYSYTVAGGPSGDGTGTATIEPDSVGLFQTVSETVTITGDGTHTLTRVIVSVPADWSWSQSDEDVELAGPGFSGVNTNYTVSNDDIIIVDAEVTDTNVGQVIIADLTAPGNPTTSTFVVKTSGAGGANIEIADSPTVKVGEAGPEYVPIADIQANPSQYEGQVVTIQGVVTIGAVVLDNQYTRAYIQDESGKGINIFDYDLISALVRGRLVEVTGTIEDYLASGASHPVTEITDVTVTVLQEGQALPDPVLLTTAAANDPQWDGTWIMVSGVMVEDPYYAGGGYNVNLDDGSGQITIRIWDTTGIDVSEFAQGDTVTAIGAHSLYRTTFQILTGYQEDIWEGPPDITGPPVITDTDHQPDSPLYTEPVVVTSHVTDDGSVSSVSLFSSINGGVSWQSAAMSDNGLAPDQTAGDDIYSSQIGPQAEGTVVRYYIQAVDDEALASLDPANAPTGYYSYTVRGGMPGDGSGTASIWPDSVDVSQAVSETLTVVGDGSNTLVSVAVIVPQNWSWPANASSVSLAGAGFSGAALSVSGDTIAITGATVTDADVGQVIVADLTAPGTPTTSTFLVKTAVEGGILSQIASSPQVTVGVEEQEYTPIADIQANVEEYEGKIVTLRAVVTIGAGALDDQYTRAYIQDESGRGINLFDFDILPEIVRGNLVEVTGTIEDYLASGAIAATTEITDVSVTLLDTDQALPDPVILSTGGAQSDQWDGTWIQVTGVMQEDPYYAGGGYNLNIDDGSGRYTIRIWDTTEIDVSEFTEGDTITAIGAGSVYSTSYQMLTGYQEDIYQGQPVTEGIGYASISPSSVKAAAEGLTETITVWSEADDTLTELSIEIPTSWNWNQPDQTGVQLSGAGFPEGATVEISGSRTILVHGAAVTASDQGVIAILDLDAPEIGEISTFRVKTAPAGQALKEIQNSPRVTVAGLEKAKLSVPARVFVPNRQSYVDAEGFRIQFNVPTNSDVVLRLFDIEGRVVRTLVDEEQYAGPGQVIWNGRDELREVVPIGVYICHLEATDRDEGTTTTDQAPIVVGTPLD